MKAVVLACALLAVVSLPALADTDSAPTRKEQLVMSTRTFLNAHPDLKHRNEGWVAYQAGDHAAALQNFRKAASYADKPSQAMMAEMLWQGLGVPADRAMAYAWADLAAERGYVQFIRLREQYWRGLDQAEQERAVRDGRVLLEEFADAVARPRMAQFMKKAKQRARRSANYASQPKSVMVPGPGGSTISIVGHRFYDPKFWDPAQYQAWQDAMWMDPPKGQVDVGDVQQVGGDGD
jgi:hypothetical protein